MDLYTTAGLGGVGPHELEPAPPRAPCGTTTTSTIEPRARRSTGPRPAALLELLEIKLISKTNARSKSARLELASAHAAWALAAYLE